MRVKIDGETCTGHGRCAKYGPNVYFLDEVDGYNSHRGTVIIVPEGEERNATMGMKACPERAITVVDDRHAEGSVRITVQD
jgi:ferredoxin